MRVCKALTQLDGRSYPMTTRKINLRKGNVSQSAALVFLFSIIAVAALGIVVRICLGTVVVSEDLVSSLVPVAAGMVICVLMNKTKLYERSLCRRPITSLLVIGVAFLILTSSTALKHQYNNELIVPLSILGISLAVYSLKNSMSAGIVAATLITGLFLLVAELCDSQMFMYVILAAGVSVILFAVVSNWFHCESIIFVVCGIGIAASLGFLLYEILVCDFNFGLFLRDREWLIAESPARHLSPSACWEMLTNAEFLGETSVVPELAAYSPLINIAFHMGLLPAILLCALYLSILIAGSILLKNRKGLTRLIGIGTIAALGMSFIAFVLGSFGIDFGRLPRVLPFYGRHWATNLGYAILCAIVMVVNKEPLYEKGSQLSRELCAMCDGFCEKFEGCLTVKQLDLTPSLRRELRESFVPSKDAFATGNVKILDDLNNTETVCVMRCSDNVSNVDQLFHIINVNCEKRFYFIRAPKDASTDNIHGAISAINNATDNGNAAVIIDPCLDEEQVDILVLGI